MHGGNTVPHTYFDELIELTCRQCVYEGKNEDEIDIHMMSIHKQFRNQCNLCDYKTATKQELEKHVQTKHLTLKVDIVVKEQIVLSCDQCDYKCMLNIQLKNHVKRNHKTNNEDVGKYKCVICSFSANFLLDMWQHRQNVHENTIPDFLPKPRSKEEVALAYLAEQNFESAEEMETLKKDFKGAFKEFAKDIEEILMI